VLTDVVMPGGSGTALVDELRVGCPDLRCIFMSGYTDDVLLRHGAREGNVMLVEKPFSRATLLRAVGDALQSGVAA
jgi:FixJ family two-component response regulator